MSLNRKELGTVPGNANNFYRRLYRYYSYSYYWRYHHRVDDLQDEINDKKIANSAITVTEINAVQLMDCFGDDVAVEVVSDKIFMKEEGFAKISLLGKRRELKK